MTPLENKFLHRLGVDYSQTLVKLSIIVFFYGMSSSLVVRGSSTSSVTGVFVVLFSASVVIFAFVFFFPLEKSPISQQAPKFDRRKGFSKRATAAVFVTTVINFILSSLNTGTQVALFIVFIRKALILDIDIPLSEKPEIINSALQNLNIVANWAANFPVSINQAIAVRSCIYSCSLGDMAQRPHCYLEGLGPLPRSTVGHPHTVHFVDWNCG